MVTLEFIPNEDRVTPPIDATFSMMMLGSTPHGDAYTFAEYDQMFHKSGILAQRNARAGSDAATGNRILQVGIG